MNLSLAADSATQNDLARAQSLTAVQNARRAIGRLFARRAKVQVALRDMGTAWPAAVPPMLRSQQDLGRTPCGPV